MFTETTLRPPAWKIKRLFIAGAVCAACMIVICVVLMEGRVTNGRLAGLMIAFGALAWMCWGNARALAGNSLNIRKFGIEVKRRAVEPEPLFIEWKEIKRIETAVFQSFNGRSSGSARYIGIRLVDKCPKRHTKEHEKNRLNCGCDILLAAIYGMSLEETVAFLREKMCEATGAQPPAKPVAATEFAPGGAPARSLSLMSIGGPIGVMVQPCIETKCPMCLGVQKFFLLEAPLNSSGSDRLIKGLVCEKCHYEVSANDDAERAKLLEAAAIWETAKSKADAMTQIGALQSEVITRIIQGAETITCPECGELVPAHFSECWKCGHILKNLPPAEPQDSPEGK